MGFRYDFTDKIKLTCFLMELLYYLSAVYKQQFFNYERKGFSIVKKVLHYCRMEISYIRFIRSALTNTTLLEENNFFSKLDLCVTLTKRAYKVQTCTLSKGSLIIY